MADTVARAVEPMGVTGPSWLVAVRTSGSETGRDPARCKRSGAGLELSTTGFSPRPRVCCSDGLEVVFEGRLYNRSELNGLVGGVADDNDNADPLLVIGAYRRWGEEAVRRLKGSFALCLWDDRRQKLLAARDRTGSVPLYYLRRTNSIYLGPCTEHFHAPGGPGLEVDRTQLAYRLAGYGLASGNTFYRALNRLPPGSLLTWSGSSPRATRYWSLPPLGKGDWVGEDAVDRFGELMDQAVGRVLGQGPAAVYLSGGLDSASVAAAATDHAARTGLPGPCALSLRLPAELDEEAVQRKVAGSLGLQQSVVGLDDAFGPSGLLQAAIELSAESAHPLDNWVLPAFRRLAVASRELGCAAVLTGWGGDKWLTGTRLAAADMLASLDIAGLLHFAGSLGRSYDLPGPAVWRSLLWRSGFRPHLARSYRNLREAVAPGRGRRRREQVYRKRLDSLPEWLAPEPSVRRALQRQMSEYHESLSSGNEAGSGNFYADFANSMLESPRIQREREERTEVHRKLGVSHYDVYWDEDLIEFLYRVPAGTLNLGGRSKGLIRHRLEGRFPGCGFGQQKKLSYQRYFRESLLDTAAAAWRQTGEMKALAALGVVEPAVVNEFAEDAFASKDARSAHQLWRLMSLESWTRARA